MQPWANHISAAFARDARSMKGWFIREFVEIWINSKTVEDVIELFWNIVIHLTPTTNIFNRIVLWKSVPPPWDGIGLGPSLVNWKLNQDKPKINVEIQQIFFSWDIGKIESWKSGNIWTGQNPELTCIGLDWGYAERGRNLCSILYYLAKKHFHPFFS